MPPHDKKEIEREMDGLACRLDSLEAGLETLEDRLRPVTREYEPTAEGQGTTATTTAPSPSTALGGQIRGTTYRIERFDERVLGILQRLELS